MDCVKMHKTGINIRLFPLSLLLLFFFLSSISVTPPEAAGRSERSELQQSNILRRKAAVPQESK
jgi:hypothetical protein